MTYRLPMPIAADLLRRVFCGQPEYDPDARRCHCEGCGEWFTRDGVVDTENGWFCDSCVCEGRHKDEEDG